MIDPIECSGHPRDMGLHQGAACRSAIVEWLQRADLPRRRAWLPDLAPYAAGSVRGRGAGREVIRHFTHLSERIDGLAREARVPVDSLLELHLRTARAGGGALLESGAIGIVSSSRVERAADVLVRSLGVFAAPSSPQLGWVVRRSRPEVGFRSLEVTLPWLASAIAGINEQGLSALYLPDRGPEGGEDVSGVAQRAAAPPILLVQECLQRFEDLEASLEWCRKRPARGLGELLIADRSGASAAVSFSGRERCTRAMAAGQWADGTGAPEARSEPLLCGFTGLDPALLSRWAAGSGSAIESAGWLALRAVDGIVEYAPRVGAPLRWSLDDPTQPRGR